MVVIILGRLYLLSGDYIDNSKDMDAIVNAANKYMINGSGICGAIYNSAGLDLIEFCKNNYQKDMINNEVRITPGFKLNMDIIHVLAPKAYEEEEPVNELMKGYKNLLDEITKNKYKNVLLCSLGTGIHGYKHEDVAKPLINLLNNYCKINDVNIYFNNYIPLYKDIYLKEYLLANVLNLKDDLSKMEPHQMLEYLKENNLIENNIKFKYKNFCKNKDLEDLCLSEKLICLQYTLENFDVTKEQLMILIESMVI